MTTAVFRALSVSLLLASAVSAQVPAGGQFRVNTDTLGDQGYARPVMQPDGNFVVVWEGPDASGTGIFGQRFAASGVPRRGEFAVNTYVFGRQARPAAAIGSKGDLVVVWEGDRTVSGASNGIQGRRFDAQGVALGQEFAVNAGKLGAHHGPDVGRSADGRFVVSWASPFSGVANPYGVWARRFDASGVPLAGDGIVSPYAPGVDTTVALEVQPNGTFVVVWENRDYYGSSGIFRRRLSADGGWLSGENFINTSWNGRRRRPSISGARDGRSVVTWFSEFGDGSGSSSTARRLDAFGTPVANEFVANTYTTGNQSGAGGQVAADELGNFVITWHGPGNGSFDGIHAQRFDADGVPRGAEFHVNTSTADPQWGPSVASDAVGNFVITWEGFGIDGSGSGSAAQRFGGLGPAALEIDTAGNGVLEAGETVDLRPAWRNFNGAPQTFSATLSGMTGPAGAAYAIVDGGGDYGTVPDGIAGPCTDCYAVSVSNPPFRPAVHWDASAVEGILPDAQGQQKQWLLHVGGTFTDVPSTSAYYRDVETLVHHGITGGCWHSTPDTFCPKTPTTREQIAPLLLVAREGSAYRPPACAGTVFKDVTSRNPFCGWIEELVRRGVVTGCAPTLYCPLKVVTREEIAVLLLRTLDPKVNPPRCVPPNVYGDVPETHPYCRWIEELANRGVVSDCGGGNYCPADGVTREQAAFFITGGFGLTLYGS